MPNVCTPSEAPVLHTSCVIELYDGAEAVGGADLTLDVELVVLVVLEELPEAYVVAPPVYPPSILVLDPLIFVCDSAECTGPPNKANKVNININTAVNL